MIEVKNLSKKFDSEIVLDNINTVFEQGVVNMIIGKSGSGKTVLLKCLVGLVTPTSGEIRYNGRNFIGLKSREVRRLRRDIGMLFQGAALFDSRTVL
ncbi:MAG: ATP-binding cassette domain-containing protein, partial [Proteiniphilum sp.]|nr:ATP-binding cassette domain-containing protein [Proteiniphilum sp.]